MATPSITPLGWLALGGLGLLAWRFWGGRPFPKAPLVSRGPVDLVGDSLAVGLAGPLGKILYERLKSPQGEVFRGWGVGGTTVSYWTGGKLDAVLAGEPAAVLVSLGTNDSVTELGRKTFAKGIAAIVDKVKKAGAAPVLLAPPPMPFSTSEVVAAMGATGAAVVAAPGGLERAPDKIHMTPKGYADWAKAIAEAIT